MELESRVGVGVLSWRVEFFVSFRVRLQAAFVSCGRRAPTGGDGSAATGEAPPQAMSLRARRMLPQGNAPFAGFRGRASAPQARTTYGCCLRPYDAFYLRINAAWPFQIHLFRKGSRSRENLARNFVQSRDLLGDSPSRHPVCFHAGIVPQHDRRRQSVRKYRSGGGFHSPSSFLAGIKKSKA